MTSEWAGKGGRGLGGAGRALRVLAALLPAALGLIGPPPPAWASSGLSRPAGLDLGDLGQFPQWSKIEIVFHGPASIGMGSPNPFQVQVDVTFTGPGAQTFVVPAFFDGDGSGGMDGDVWKVRFSPDTNGAWSFQTSSGESLLDGITGAFDVTSSPGCQPATTDGLPNFLCVGRLEYTGGHYLGFADGGAWLKGGANEPEDILAPGVNAGFSSKQAAVDFLAARGANSLYVMLDNIGGDRRDVWPWVGSTESQAQANHERFDVAKLAGWESFFEYAQQKGIVLHVVFEDDSAWEGFNRAMYYREMVARFGHHNGLFWDISEEYNESYSAAEVKSFAQMLTDLDAYDHPLTVHNQGSLNHWLPFLGDARFDLTSFQTSTGPQNPLAVTWFDLVESSSRTIPTGFDEATRNLQVTDRDLFRHTVWSIYMGGGNTEIYTRFSPGVAYPQYDLQFRDMTRARGFLEGSDYPQMRPRNDLLLSGSGYVLAQDGVSYLAYLPAGGTILLNLSDAGGNLSGQWFDPRTGATQSIGTVQGGGSVALTAPNGSDWAMRLSTGDVPTPTATLTLAASPSPSATPTPVTPTSTSTPTPTHTPFVGTASPTPTATPTPFVPTGTPSATPSATQAVSTTTSTPSPVATDTPAAATPTSTVGGGRVTQTPSFTFTPSLTPSPTSTLGPGTPSATPAPPTPTDAPGGRATPTPSPTLGPGTPSATPTGTNTPGGRGQPAEEALSSAGGVFKPHWGPFGWGAYAY